MAATPTIIPRDPKLVPVSKDGKFLGYADKDQIAAYGLEIYAGDMPAAPAKQEPEAPKAPEGDSGAKPDAVRKGPAPKKPE